MSGERTVAQRAQAMDIATSVRTVDLQAGMVIRVKWTEIEASAPSWPGPIQLDKILDVVRVIVPGDGYSLAGPCGG